MTNVANPLSPGEADAKAGNALLSFLRANKLGTLTKQEAEIAMFDALVRSHQINPDSSALAIGRELHLPPARVRSLLLRYRMQYGYAHEANGERRTTAEQIEERRFLQLLQQARFVRNGEYVEFLVRDPYLKQVVIARVEALNSTIDLAFSSNILRVPLETFVEVYANTIVDKRRLNRWKDQLRRNPDAVLQTARGRTVAVIRAATSLILRDAGGKLVEDVLDRVIDGRSADDLVTRPESQDPAL